MMNRPMPQPTYAAMPKPGNTLVSDILPRLVEHIMCNRDPDLRPDPAEGARRVFEALEALEREQKIKDHAALIDKTIQLELSLARAATVRNWKVVTLLVQLYFAELATSSSLEVVCNVAFEQDTLTRDAASQAGVEAVVGFGVRTRALIAKCLDEETKRATEQGRHEQLKEAKAHHGFEADRARD